MQVEIIVTVDGMGYKGIFNDTMTQEEILNHIVSAFTQLKLFPEENIEPKIEIVEPKAENLQVLERLD